MTAYDAIFNYTLDGGVILVILLTLIQIAPIKFDPWSKIASGIGKAINKDLEKEITEIKEEIKDTTDKVNALTDRLDENTAINARYRILRFGDEVTHGTNHSKDHFQQILNDITNYEKYCVDHPMFKNNMTAITSKRIKDDYTEKDKYNSFL